MSKSEIIILSDPKNPRFGQTLVKYSRVTDNSNANEVFNALLSNFDKKISQATGTAILSAVTSIIQRSGNANIFISKGFLNNLPYGDENYSDIIFDIFYICIKADINVFDDVNKYVGKFEKQISFNPRKALIIIAIHVSNFQYIAHPWLLSDLLISQFQIFLSSSELASFHLNLISYLCNQYPTYRKHRTAQCWSLLSQLLESELVDQTICKQIYQILFSISNNNSEVKNCFQFLPIKKVVEHIKNPSLKSDVISFIAINAEEFKSCNDIIKALLIESRKNEKASLILMKLAEDESNALLLFSDDIWLQDKLPTYLETLKIVYNCMAHTKVRKSINKSKYIFPLLIRASKTTQLSVITMILGVIQKLRLSKSIVSDLSKYGLLNNIIKATNSNKDDPNSDKILYRIFGYIASIDFVQELLKLIDLSSEEIILKSDLYEEALSFIFEAVKHKQFTDNLKSTELVGYFKQIKLNQHNIKKDKKVQKNIQIIEQIIKILDQFHLFDEDEDDEYYEEEEEYINGTISNVNEEEDEE